MDYTVKGLSKLSGVSVRTLHYYDEIGLLKPKFKGQNNYRYYKEEQLLRLQQILFFRELGFSLNDIQKLLSQSDFDNVDALQAHRKILENEITRKQSLIATIDKTIKYIEGREIMKSEELYCGFECLCTNGCQGHCDCQKKYEQYIVKYYGHKAEDLLIESKRKLAKWDKHEWEDVKNEGDAIHKALARAINDGFAPDSKHVQGIIAQHYKMINRFYDCTNEIYIGLTELYAEHPDFRKFFDAYHPKMVEFIGEAMRYYAKHEL